MESLILLVKRESLSYNWKNGKVARFDYDEANVWYQLIEADDDGLNYIVSQFERTLENCPVVAHGFVAYLIHNWGRPETEIYKEFYELCLSEFIRREEKKPGAFKRDLNTEYYILHIPEEKAKVAYSQKIYPYLTGDDTKLVNQYLESYFDFIKINYSKPSSEKEDGPSTDKISVSTWALYYHYLQKSKSIPYFENHPISKDEAIKELLSSNNHKFSFGNFRNIFYAIGKVVAKDPLTPLMLKKVIPLLAKYPIAKQLAENDLYSFGKQVTMTKRKQL